MDTILLPVMLDGTWRYSCSSKAPQNASDVHDKANADWFKNAGLDIGQRPEARDYTSPPPAPGVEHEDEVEVQDEVEVEDEAEFEDEEEVEVEDEVEVEEEVEEEVEVTVDARRRRS